MAYDEWMTNPNVIELVREAMGSIDYDPASNFVAQQYIKATEYCIAPNDGVDIPEDISGQCYVNGLTRNWQGNVFLNPPYSTGNIDRFVAKSLDEWAHPRVNQMIILVNSATDTAWYHRLLAESNVVLLWRGRIKFWKIENGQVHEKWEGVKSKEAGLGKVGNSPRYLNTLFYFGSHTDRFRSVFENKGTFLWAT